MKSAVFYGKHDIRVEETPMPVPGPGEVLIQVKACGVCGTDVHIFEGDKGAADCTPPTIIGHEFSGIVEGIGEGVRRFRVGDRVSVDPNANCGACQYCHEGNTHFCENMTGYGTTCNGGFAQYCVVPESQCYLLGKNTSFLGGAMGEPLACCLHGIELAEVLPGSDVVILGGGMIGLIMLQLAALKGAARIAAVEPVAEKREKARQLGACLCIDPAKSDVAETLASNGFRRITSVIECVGRPETVELAVKLADKKSVVMLFGLTKPDETVSIKPFELFQNEIALKASFINPNTQQQALNLIDAGRIDVTSMMLPPISLAELKGALSDPALRARGKIIVDPWL